MEDEEVIYFVDQRNADRRADRRDDRRRAFQPGRPGRIRPPAASSGPRVIARSPAPPAAMPQAPGFVPVASGAAATGFAVGSTPAYWRSPSYGRPCGSPLGNLTLGDVVSLLAQGFAAFRTLPVPPAPANCEACELTDVANSVAFRDAIAREQGTQKKLEFAGRAAGDLLGVRTSFTGLGARTGFTGLT